MKFDFVFVAFFCHDAPPLARVLKDAGQDYRFSPLAEDCAIYTADAGLWRGGRGIFDERADIFCPSFSNIAQAIAVAERDDCYFVMALTQLAQFIPPGSVDMKLSLISKLQVAEALGAVKLTEVGIDVVDQWTGLSALTNVSYSENYCLKLKNLKLKLNQFGLFATLDNAERFVHFASVAAPEHAPFIPVKVHVRIPTSASTVCL